MAMHLARYTGYLAPWRPVIAAMALCGQTPMQIGRLLYALGARQDWEIRQYRPWAGLPSKEEREYSAGCIVRLLLKSWPIPAPAPTPPPAPPSRRKVLERYEWTPESNWAEIQAHRGIGP